MARLRSSSRDSSPRQVHSLALTFHIVVQSLHVVQGRREVEETVLAGDYSTGKRQCGRSDFLDIKVFPR